jgi:hypothetical protein
MPFKEKKYLIYWKKNKLQRDYIELNSRNQASDGSWAKIRKLMIQSSNFYEASVGSIENGIKKSQNDIYKDKSQY